MSNFIFNLRIGKLHIQITNEYKVRFAINDYHKWFKWPFIQLH